MLDHHLHHPDEDTSSKSKPSDERPSQSSQQHRDVDVDVHEIAAPSVEVTLPESMTISKTSHSPLIAELSGSLGDMGTLLPLLVSLTVSGQINLTASLVFGGLFNIALGSLFGVPLCVQPMKALAATALASHLTTSQLVAAGFCVSAIIFCLAGTRTLALATRLIPLPLIRGIQLGTGVQLVIKGIATVQQGTYWDYSNFSGLTNNLVIALLAFTLTMLCFNMRRNPSALILFGYGIIVALVRAYAVDKVPMPPAGPSFMTPFAPTADDFRVGFTNAALGQLPLTLLNSVVATAKFAGDSFPEKRLASSVTAIGLAVGSLNIVSMWFGCIPYCSGSGGIAGQYRFGARTGLSVVVLGVFKILVGLAFGGALLPILSLFPKTILGVMLVLAGVELAAAAKDVGGVGRDAHDRFVVTLVTGGVVAGWANDGVGFLAGVIACFCLWAVRRKELGQGILAGVIEIFRDAIRDEFRTAAGGASDVEAAAAVVAAPSDAVFVTAKSDSDAAPTMAQAEPTSKSDAGLKEE